MDEGFSEAIIHRRAPLAARALGYSGHVVLGRRLRPFSFWHQQLLQGIDSPFLAPAAAPNSIQLFQDLYLAREICRLTPPHIPARNFRAVLRRKLAVSRWFMLPFLTLLRSVATTRYLRLLIEAAKFRAYLADYCSAPIAFPTRDSRPVQSPVGLYQMSLYRRYHPRVSIEQVWRMSPGEVAWANVGAQEAAGAKIEIMTAARLEARRIAMQGGPKKKTSPNGNGANSNGPRK